MDEQQLQVDRPAGSAQPKGADFEAYRRELEQLQKVDFVLVELTLYLDTHPTDMQAIQQYNQLTQSRHEMARAFELKFGPLMAFGHSFTRFPWQWVQTPWPWQV